MASTEIRLLAAAREPLLEAVKDRKVDQDAVYPKNCVEQAQAVINQIAEDFPQYYEDNQAAFNSIETGLTTAVSGYEEIQKNIDVTTSSDCSEEDRSEAEVAIMDQTTSAEGAVTAALAYMDALLENDRKAEIAAERC